MDIVIGLLIIAIGAFCQSSSYVPINKVKQWSWESYWLVQGVFAWLVFPIFILGIFEGLIHTMGIFIFKLGKPSPGWYTAIVMLGFSIWSIVVINQNIDYAPIQWLWTALYYIGSFLLLEVWFQHLLGSNIQRFAKAMRSHMIKNVLKR